MIPCNTKKNAATQILILAGAPSGTVRMTSCISGKTNSKQIILKFVKLVARTFLTYVSNSKSVSYIQ